MANKELRDTVDGCEDGTIKGYPDLEIASINEFMGYLMESTRSLMANADRAMRDVGWLDKVKYKDNLDPQPEEQSESKRAHGRKQSQSSKARRGSDQPAHCYLPAERKSQQACKIPRRGGPNEFICAHKGTGKPVQAGTDIKSPAGSQYPPPRTPRKSG